MAEPLSVTKDNFDQAVLKSSLPILVDFWAAWCGPCRAVAPVVEELANEYSGKVNFAKLNVDENPELAQKYGVMSIPTLILFKAGQPAQRMVGMRPKAEFKKVLDAA